MAKNYQASMADAIPIVRTTAQRDDMRQRMGACLTRVQNLETGYFERFDPTDGWVSELPVGASGNAGSILWD